MKLFKKTIAVAMGCAFAVCGLAGCGDRTEGPPPLDLDPDDIVTELDPNTTTGTISLGYKNENNEEKIAKQLADSFKEKFPNVTVQLTAFTGETSTAIDKLYRSGSMPDVFLTNSFDMLAIDAKYENLLLDLNPFIEKEEAEGTFNRNDYYSTWWKLGQRNFDGAQFMVPRAADRVVVHYNKKKVKEAEAKTGKEILKYIKNGWTWDDFNTVCELLKESQLSNYIVDSNMDWEAVYNPILTYYGVEYFDEAGELAIDSPKTHEALDFIKAWVDKGYVAPPNSGSAADFDYGKGFMHFQSRALSTTLDILKTRVWSDLPADTDWSENYDVVTMPVFADNPLIGVGAAGYCASATTKDLNLVWQFMKHIISKEGQNAIAEIANLIPIRKDMADYTNPANRWGVGYEKFNLSAFTFNSGNIGADGKEEPNWNCYTDYFLKKPAKYAVSLNDVFGDYLIEAYANGDRSYELVMNTLKARVEQTLRR